MKLTLIATGLILATPALAQNAYPPVDVSSLVTPDQLAAVASMVPTMATTSPTCIADNASVGAAVNQFSPANHTHCSKIRKYRAVAVTTATYAWTYPTAFTTGIVPVCQAIVEDPANSANDSYNVEIAGVPTATSATFRIIRQSTGLLSLLTGALSINPTPGNVNLHLTCFEP